MAAPLGPAVPVVEASPHVTDDCPIFLPADDDLVTSTPMLDWGVVPPDPQGNARVSLRHFQMVRSFLFRCSLSRIGVDLQAAHALSTLTPRVPAPTWSRILTEYKSSGLVGPLRDVGAATLSEFDKVLEELAIINPAQLELSAADLQMAEAFNTPGAPAVPAVPAVRRGRRILQPAVAAVAAVKPTQGPDNLEFLDIARLPYLEDGASRVPLLGLSILSGALGPCSTQAVWLQPITAPYARLRRCCHLP